MKLLVYAFAAAAFFPAFAIWRRSNAPKTRKPIACLEASREQVLTYIPKAFAGLRNIQGKAL